MLGLDVGGFWIKGFVNLYLLLIPLVAVPGNLLREVEGHTIFPTDGGLHYVLVSLDT